METVRQGRVLAAGAQVGEFAPGGGQFARGLGALLARPICRLQLRLQSREGFAIRGGVRSLEHGMMLDDEVLKLMVEQGTYWSPTLSVYFPEHQE